MKPVFGTDLTNNKANEDYNADPFVIATPDEATLREFEKLGEQAEETVKKSGLPLPLTIAKYVLGGISAIVLGSTLSAGAEVGFAQAWENAAWLICIGIACLPAFLALWIYGRLRERKVMEQDDTQALSRSMDQYAELLRQQLNVPDNAKHVELLFFDYKEKDGEIRPVSDTPLINLELEAFRTEEHLCFSDLHQTFGFPLSSLTRISTVRKRTSLISWDKEESIKSPQYKPYHLTTNDMGFVFCKEYHVLELEQNGEKWGIWFPPYELPTMEALTGLKAEPPAQKNEEEA